MIRNNLRMWFVQRSGMVVSFFPPLSVFSARGLAFNFRALTPRARRTPASAVFADAIAKASRANRKLANCGRRSRRRRRVTRGRKVWRTFGANANDGRPSSLVLLIFLSTVPQIRSSNRMILIFPVGSSRRDLNAYVFL